MWSTSSWHLSIWVGQKSETSSNSGRWFNNQPSQSSAKDSPESSSWPKRYKKVDRANSWHWVVDVFFTVELGECDGKSPISTLSFSEIKSRFAGLNFFGGGAHIWYFSSDESFPQCQREFLKKLQLLRIRKNTRWAKYVGDMSFVSLADLFGKGSTCQRPGPSIPKRNPALLGGEKKLDPPYEIREIPQLYM